jgi:hypothetical protein
MLEALAETDEEFMEVYLSQADPTQVSLEVRDREATASGGMNWIKSS